MKSHSSCRMDFMWDPLQASLFLPSETPVYILQSVKTMFLPILVISV